MSRAVLDIRGRHCALGGTAAIVLLVLLTCGVILPVGSPSILAPASMPVALPLLLWGGGVLWHQIAVVSAAFALLFLVPYVALAPYGKTTGAIVSGFAVLCMVLSVTYWTAGWRYGLRYEGRAYTITHAAENLVCYAALIALIIRARASAPARALLHWATLAWLVWCAFPWLGEVL